MVAGDFGVLLGEISRKDGASKTFMCLCCSLADCCGCCNYLLTIIPKHEKVQVNIFDGQLWQSLSNQSNHKEVSANLLGNTHFSLTASGFKLTLCDWQLCDCKTSIGLVVFLELLLSPTTEVATSALEFIFPARKLCPSVYNCDASMLACSGWLVCQWWAHRLM